MVARHPYRCDGQVYDQFYQTGGQLPVFIGTTSPRSQRGSGLGSVLGGLFRMAVPLLKRGGKALLKQGAKTGLQIAQDVMSGQTLKAAAQQRAKETGKQMFQRVMSEAKGSIKRRRQPSTDARPFRPATASAAATRPAKRQRRRRSKQQQQQSKRSKPDIFT